MKPEYHVLNLGAGVQSTTLYLLPVFGEDEHTESLRDNGLDFGDPPSPVPWFDAAIFADTGDEPDSVYRHVRWMMSLDGPPIVVANAGCGVLKECQFVGFVDRIDRHGRDDADAWLSSCLPKFARLSDVLIHGRGPTGYSTRKKNGNRFASIPAFTSAVEGMPGGKTRRQCTREYKTQVVEQAIRRHLLGLPAGKSVPKSVTVHQYLGLSRDEPSRVARVAARFRTVRWARAHFPLYERCVERADCRRYLATRVPHRVPRSACTFCPFHDNSEWRAQRDGDPSGWARSVRVDEAIRGEGAVCGRFMEHRLYVHRSCLPLVVAPIGDADQPQDFAEECEGMCGV